MRILILILLISNPLFSQEIESTIKSSPRVNLTHDKLFNQQITLPFFDDFSNSDGILNTFLWQDNSAYLNRNYPVNPPTLGVVTLDGLDSNGFAYDINISNSSSLADQLTSHSINLINASQPLFLMFFFQAQGIGDNPQLEDSLILEFAFDSLGFQLWENVWSISGENLSEFKKVVIMIDNPKFLTSEFQFRFRNYATLSGNYDHWHLDYIKLSELNNSSDTSSLNDISFVFDSPSILQRYYQMPWVHFRDNIVDEIKDSLNILLRNNQASVNVDYQYNIYENNLQIDHYPNLGISRNVTVLEYDSISNYIFSNPPISIDNSVFTSGLLIDSISFVFEHILGTANNDVKINDTLLHEQIFQSHFAYDDGSVESAYGINVSGALAAYQFKLNRPDTLRAIQMYFPQMLDSVNSIPFYLTVWDDNNGLPGNIIHQQIEYPVHTPNFNYFSYNLDSLFQITNNFYIGWQQTSDDLLNIGLDKNNSANDYMYYNVAGTWNNSSYQGAWMIRPVVSMSPIILEVNDNFSNSLSYYPNPVKDILNIKSNTTNNNISIYDISGKLIKVCFQPKMNFSLNLNKLTSGIYFLTINNPRGVNYCKIIVQ